MHRIITTAATAVLMSFSLLVFAQDDQAAQLEQQIEQLRTRLNLNDEQVAAISPVLKDSIREQRRILSTYGVNLESRDEAAGRLGIRQARSMRNELQVVREETLGALQPILDKEQLEEFQRIQEERRAEMRERIRGGR